MEILFHWDKKRDKGVCYTCGAEFVEEMENKCGKPDPLSWEELKEIILAYSIKEIEEI